MQAFDFVSARSVDEVVAALAAGGERARPLSGGTDLLAQMKEGRRSYATVVDLKRIPALMEVRIGDNGLWLGASVPCHTVNNNADIQKMYPALHDSTGLIGGTQVQGRASLGGNLCNASPAADGIPNLIVHSAVAHIAGPNGERQVAVEDFCTAPGRTVLQNGEVLVALEFPAPVKNFGAAYLRFIPRNEMDIAVVGVGASVVLSSDGQTIESARISLGAVAPTPLYVKAAGDALAGQPVSEETFEKAAQIAWEAAKPISDMRGTIAQRKHLAGVLTKRALRIAIDRARGTKTVDSLGRLNGNG